ncbi:MAG TPA: YciI family protein [Solirubrobacteraceae bacterium]|nr:YciI family protein [Solirubrobacteraceae bacterium]
MNYLLFICSDGVATAEKAEAMRRHVPGWVEEMDRRGVRRFGHALAPPSAARTVRVRDGEMIVTDGPFAESREFVAGFDLIECADLDEAIEVAAKHPVSWFHSVEIRPLADFALSPSGSGTEGEALIPDDPIAPLTQAPAPGRRRYMLAICLDGVPESDEEEAAIRRDSADWLSAAIEQGVQVHGHALKHAETATTVRVRGGETLVSDGPFIETREFIGGIDVVDCASPQEAVELAARLPLARYHMIEVRPFATEG